MKPRLFLICSLLAILLTSACASNATATQSVVEPSATVLGATIVVPTATQVSTKSPASATSPVDVQPVATSRGPELHATDPTTVSLASGQIQFVEFFRFT